MSAAIQLVLLAASIPVMVNPHWFTIAGDGVTSCYSIATVVLLTLTVGQVVAAYRFSGRWGFALPSRLDSWAIRMCPLVLLIVGGIVIAKLFAAFRGVPLDPMKADMLPLLKVASWRFLSGHNPYVIYTDAAPWRLPLVYGPVLWMPYVLTSALNADPRYLTVSCMALVVLFLLGRAMLLARRGDQVSALLLAGLVLALFTNKPVLDFVKIGHTQVYWPLFVLLYWAIERGRLFTASVLLGLLVVARSTMLAIVPVFLIYLLVRERSRLLQCGALVAVSIVLPLLPFALLDHHSLYESMVLNYYKVIKPMAWSNRELICSTLGAASYFVKNGIGDYLQYLQIGAMAVVYLCALVVLRRREHLMVWKGLALMVFSMTVFWPVRYIYFDVVILLALACTTGLDSFNKSGEKDLQESEPLGTRQECVPEP